MSVEIISLEQLDLEQWRPLWQGYLTFYKSEMSEQQIRLSWKRITNHEQDDMFGYALIHNNQMIGFVHLISHMSMWTEKPYCYLQDLYIDENFRMQGFARKLIEYSYEVCAEKFDRVYWLTHESNITAQHLYDQVANQTGFIQYKKSFT